MSQEEFSKVLSNWIKEALSLGELPKGKSAEDWIADRVMNWWNSQTAEDVIAIESSSYAIREELQRLGGWDRREFHEVMHELIHLDDNIADLRKTLGINDAIHG